MMTLLLFSLFIVNNVFAWTVQTSPMGIWFNYSKLFRTATTTDTAISVNLVHLVTIPPLSLNNMSKLHLNLMHFLFCTLLPSDKKSASAPASLVATEKQIQREQLYSCLIMSDHCHCRNQSKFGWNIFEERDHTASLFAPLAFFSLHNSTCKGLITKLKKASCLLLIIKGYKPMRTEVVCICHDTTCT